MLTKPHVLVVGGSSGLGKVFAQSALGIGYDVTILSRSPAASDAWYSCDIANSDQLASTMARIARERMVLSSLAFFQRWRGSADDWEGELRTSLTATKAVIDLSLPMLKLSGNSSIVVVSSVNAMFVSKRIPCSYHVAKAGMCQMVRYYASTLGEKGIRVNGVCPGTFVKPETENYYREHPDIAQAIARASPLCRMGTCADVANVILFLLSDKSSFITGQCLVVDGGASLQWQESLLL